MTKPSSKKNTIGFMLTPTEEDKEFHNFSKVIYQIVVNIIAEL